MLENPALWTTVAFFLFIALAYRKVTSFFAAALDARAAKIKAELDEARRLREEAQALLSEYKEKQAHYLKEAETILANARRDAATLTAHAEQELKAALDARMKHAMDRIAQEEANAINDVRSSVLDVSMAAARKIIAAQPESVPQEELVAQALSDIERKIH